MFVLLNHVEPCSTRGLRKSLVFCWADFRVVTLSLALTGLLCGCGKDGPKPSLAIESKFAAIRSAGEPATTAELNAWYPKPPGAENAALLYTQAFAALVSEDTNSPSFVGDNKRALELLHDATTRAQSRFPVDLRPGYKALLPHLRKIKICATLLAREAFVNATNGHMTAASQSVVDGLRLARSLEQEPVAVSQLVRFVAERTAAGSLERALAVKAFSDADLARMQSAFEEAEKGDAGAFARALVGERCSTVEFFLAPAQEPQELLEATVPSTPRSFIQNYRKGPNNEPDFALCLDWYGDLIAAAKSPFPEALQGLTSWTNRMMEAKARHYAISATLLSKVPVMFERWGAMMADIRSAQAVIAIERYRLGHSGAPTALTALTPQYLSAVPTDPFDGKALRYKRQSPRAYVVYSVGPDREDNNGAVPKSTDPTQSNFDLIFTVER